MLPRGIRNNNPGNIRRGQKWQGLSTTQTDKSFDQFISPEYGIRALIKILKSYHKKGYDSVEEVINRWAPPVENDTGAYVKAVANALGVDKDYVFEFDKDTIIGITKAIVIHENGKSTAGTSYWYYDGVYNKAWEMAT